MHKHKKTITNNFTVSSKIQMRNKDDACLVLSQALILQLKHVALSPGSHFIYAGVPAQSFTYKAHG
ncbi:hypothetical protein AHAS_Ahas12G0140000 [Arachis hypogaea]